MSAKLRCCYEARIPRVACEGIWWWVRDYFIAAPAARSPHLYACDAHLREYRRMNPLGGPAFRPKKGAPPVPAQS